MFILTNFSESLKCTYKLQRNKFSRKGALSQILMKFMIAAIRVLQLINQTVAIMQISANL